MTDDLVKRLREDQPVTQDMGSTMQCALQDAAADRIEELEAKLRKSALQELASLGQASEAYQAQLAAEAKLAKAVEALKYYAQDDDDGGWLATETLAELSSVSCANTTGGKDE